ncbi:MAG: DUF4276 family protein [Mediterranea sp.]|jgi:hypothetical protein|nr:DUF4276 family protein [Mediterranea sp.]
MHFDFYVEDQSGEKALEMLLPRMIGKSTFNIHSYKGIGHIPKGLKPKTDASKRILLDRLPKILSGLGKSYQGFPAAIIVVCDLDNRDKEQFLAELEQIKANCDPCPTTLFCLAIEEMEAWLLGDIPAIKKAYPHAKMNILNAYKNDSICGTWEVLADAIHKGGHTALKKEGWSSTGAAKSRWAENIAPHMDLQNNSSPSFNDFIERIKALNV